jgi:hypothetical protein
MLCMEKVQYILKVKVSIMEPNAKNLKYIEIIFLMQNVK